MPQKQMINIEHRKERKESVTKPHVPLLAHYGRRTNFVNILCTATDIRLESSAHYAVFTSKPRRIRETEVKYFSIVSVIHTDASQENS